MVVIFQYLVLEGEIGPPPSLFQFKFGFKSGYLFILCIEILALALKKLKAKPYKCKKGNYHLQEQYADDLTIFLEYTKDDDGWNTSSIKCVLSVLVKLYVLSGLGVNKSKTMLSIFGNSVDGSELAIPDIYVTSRFIKTMSQS